MQHTKLAFALVLGLGLAAPTLGAAASADSVPSFNPRPGCAAAIRDAAAVRRDMDSCLRSENDARDKLKADWKTFAVPDRQRCADRTMKGGPPSYVEVLTCLEMAKAARELPKSDDGLDVGLNR